MGKVARGADTPLGVRSMTIGTHTNPWGAMQHQVGPPSDAYWALEVPFWANVHHGGQKLVGLYCSASNRRPVFNKRPELVLEAFFGGVNFTTACITSDRFLNRKRGATGSTKNDRVQTQRRGREGYPRAHGMHKQRAHNGTSRINEPHGVSCKRIHRWPLGGVLILHVSLMQLSKHI